MSTTNYLQWNPDANNQETDSQYLADAQRLAGAVNPEFFDAKLGNKLFFQQTTFSKAFADAAVALGFDFNDDDLAALTTTIEDLLTGGAQRKEMITVAYGASVVFDCSLADGFVVTLTGNLSFTFTNKLSGQPITLCFIQDGSGGHTVTYPGDCIGAGTVDGTANAVNLQGFQTIGVNVRAKGPLVIT